MGRGKGHGRSIRLLQRVRGFPHFGPADQPQSLTIRAGTLIASFPAVRCMIPARSLVSRKVRVRAMPRKASKELGPAVVEAALAIATEVGWEQVRLHAIAERTGLALAEIGRHFRDVDAVANAWFAQARQAMLAVAAEELSGLPADERIAGGLRPLAGPSRTASRIARQILRYKLHPSHLHHWVPLVFDLSRLVHDSSMPPASRAPGRLRQAQEVGLTAIVLATLRDWLRDDSPGQERSRQRLARRLAPRGPPRPPDRWGQQRTPKLNHARRWGQACLQRRRGGVMSSCYPPSVGPETSQNTRISGTLTCDAADGTVRLPQSTRRQGHACRPASPSTAPPRR